MRLLATLVPLGIYAHSYVPLAVKYPAARRTANLTSYKHRASQTTSANAGSTTEIRPCDPPLDIVILQQADSEWSGANSQTIKNQLSMLTKDIQSNHPQSKFLLATYTNVFQCPKYPHGLRMIDNYNNFTAAYDNITYTAVGNGHPLDSLAALSIVSRDVPWSQDSTRIILHITSAPPTYHDDGLFRDSSLGEPSGKFACGAEYSPSPSMTISELTQDQVYTCHAVYDPKYLSGLTGSSWRVFNRLNAQPDTLVNIIEKDASDLKAKASSMLSRIINVQCGGSSAKKRRLGDSTKAEDFVITDGQLRVDIGGGRPDILEIKLNNKTYA